MRRKQGVPAVLAASRCLTAAACGTAAATAAAGGPRGKRHDRARELPVPTTYTEPPERVVAMNGASVAEASALLALGLGDRIVANQQRYGRSEVPGRAAAVDKLPTGDVTANDAHDIPRKTMPALRPDLALSATFNGFDAKHGFATRGDLASVGANRASSEFLKRCMYIGAEVDGLMVRVCPRSRGGTGVELAGCKDGDVSNAVAVGERPAGEADLRTMRDQPS
ncbi:hypothetical protein [Streptomyces sp. BA2]|uniref:hypothetical protein n=1 Tax=Streptomyces sp. BA2 TaxID=436595 RepID=UPI001922C8B6|nr:hypothetical protein [Streptomyces sp. BA2]